MSKIRSLFLLVLATLLVFKTSALAVGTNDDPALYCSPSGVVAIGALIAGIVYFLPTLSIDEDNPNDEKVISFGFLCCASDNKGCGTIKIIEDLTKMTGFREIIKEPRNKCKKLRFQFNGHDLPTRIGKRGDGVVLFSEKGSEGCLNYGPYLSLPKGNYYVQINLALSPSNVKLGSWDIFVVRLIKVIKNGDISESNIGINFVVTDQLEGEAFEIRTFSNGNGVIYLSSIIIEQI